MFMFGALKSLPDTCMSVLASHAHLPSSQVWRLGAAAAGGCYPALGTFWESGADAGSCAGLPFDQALALLCRRGVRARPHSCGLSVWALSAAACGCPEKTRHRHTVT